MNALWGLFILTGMIYGVFIDGMFWKIYLGLVVAYFGFVMLYKNGRDNPLRRIIMLSTWGGKYINL